MAIVSKNLLLVQCETKVTCIFHYLCVYGSKKGSVRAYNFTKF